MGTEFWWRNLFESCHLEDRGHLTEAVCKNRKWIKLAQNRVKWRNLVVAVLYLWVLLRDIGTLSWMEMHSILYAIWNKCSIFSYSYSGTCNKVMCTYWRVFKRIPKRKMKTIHFHTLNLLREAYRSGDVGRTLTSTTPPPPKFYYQISQPYLWTHTAVISLHSAW